MSNRYIARAFSTMQKFLKENVVRDKTLAKETTMRVGGPAAIFAIADSLEHLKIVIDTAKDWGLPLFVIGKGSNLLVSDSGFPGVVLRLGQDFMQRKIDKNKIQAGAAVSLPSLVQEAARHSLAGLSFAVGIPGSLGGALATNAGAHESCIGDIVKNVIIYTRSCELKVLTGDDLRFEYRKGSFEDSDIVVEATLNLKPGDSNEIKREMEEFFAERKESQPLQFPSAGCVFKNPKVGVSAGKLIAESGCKGMRMGNAEVSAKHANFIVNCGHATASDIYNLLRAVQKRVFELHGVILEPEIRFLGEFDDVLLPAPDRL